MIQTRVYRQDKNKNKRVAPYKVDMPVPLLAPERGK